MSRLGRWTIAKRCCSGIHTSPTYGDRFRLDGRCCNSPMMQSSGRERSRFDIFLISSSLFLYFFLVAILSVSFFVVFLMLLLALLLIRVLDATFFDLDIVVGFAFFIALRAITFSFVRLDLEEEEAKPETARLPPRPDRVITIVARRRYFIGVAERFMK
ncbi:MAG: hypothetical protein ACI8RD_005805 [Bacillariaceae sp.]|jgi:hypothetical protein